MPLKTFLSALFLFFILVFAAYLDSPYSVLNKNYSYTADQPIKVQPATAIPAEEDVPVMEERLEKREKVDGYIVETYEEYEVFKDKEGHILKSEPTGKTDTLKYWDYNNKDR